jgi:CDP-6-deoxy-D-xylo-4-hexulose-3-dehydrase
VITGAAGFPTAVAPIIQHGCVPVLVDVNLKTHNVDVDLPEVAVTTKTRAVMIAHSLGNPFGVVRAADICCRNDLWLVEDCCDAFNATIAG